MVYTSSNVTRVSLWRTALTEHREALAPLLRKRTPRDLTDGSSPANAIKRFVRIWNAEALRLLEASPSGSAHADTFRALGRMRYTTLTDVKEQLRKRARLFDEVLGGEALPPPGKNKGGTSSKGRIIRPPAGRANSGTRPGKFDYDVCLSFAGEDRPYVSQVAEGLKAAGVRVFYDRDMEAELWGQDLYAYLDDLYRNRARYCVMFISRHYAKKVWTNHERQSAQARAFKENTAYILPARFDATEIPGDRPTTGYLDIRRRTPAAVATKVLEKLGRSVPAQPHGSAARQVSVPRTKQKVVKRSMTSAGSLALLGKHFYPVQNVRRKGSTVQVDVLARNAREAADLRRLDPHESGVQTMRIRFAHLTDAGWARVTSVASAGSGKARFTVDLDIERPTGRSTISTFGTSPREAAEHQARQVLLGEAPPTTGNRIYIGTLNDAVRGGVLALAIQGERLDDVALVPSSCFR